MRNLCRIFIGIVYSYITELSLQISYKIKNLWYTFDLLVNIRLINKETCEHVNISVWEKWVSQKYDFQCIYLTKLEYRTSLKSLRTFKIIRDDMTVPVYLFQLVKYITFLATALDIHYLSLSCQKKKKLLERFHAVTKL